MGERFLREHSHFAPSILFQKYLKEVFERNEYFLGSFTRLARVWRKVLSEGSREHVNRLFLIKNFRERKTNAAT
jgi:hypothetical protein